MPTGEAGVNATTVPATRFITFAEQGEGKPGTAVAYANPSDTSALVTFTAKDVDGETVASVAKTLLSNGHGAQNMEGLFDLTSFTGSLEITSTEPIVTLSINAEAAPVFSSLPPGEVDAADIAGEMLAPADEAAFNDLFVGKRAATNFPTVYADFVSPGRFRETQGAETYTGSYTYRNTGSNTGTVTFNYDDGDRCTTSLTFTSAMAGTATFTCAEGESGEYTWQLVEIPASGSDSFGVGDTLPGVPTAGQLFPVSGWATEWSGVTFSATTDRSTTYLTFDDGGYITLKTGTRYTCRAAGGCRVGNGVISRGTFVTSTAFAPPPDPPAPPMSSTCAAGLVIQTDGSCDVVVGGSTVGTFSVSSTSGCLRIGGINICAGAGHNIQGSRFNQYLITFVANRRQDGSWEITRYSISL